MQLDGCDQQIADAVYQMERKRRGLDRPHPKRAHAKRAKARVMYATSRSLEKPFLFDFFRVNADKRKDSAYCVPVLVTRLVREDGKPFTKKQARAAARFWNLGEEERTNAIDDMLKTMLPQINPIQSRDAALVILNLIAPK